MKIAVRYFFGVLSLFFTTKVFSQHAGCATSTMSMQQLRQLAQGSRQPGSVQFIPVKFEIPQPDNTGNSKSTPLPSAIFLPRWSAADLPVFCRIEHEIGRKMPVMVKFRLGSVEYVDWLEGK